MKELEKIKRIKQEEIADRLLAHFKYHIGEDEATNSTEIFQVVTGINPQFVDSLTRFYWWSIIEKSIRKLRREDTAFIIKKEGKFFVLKSQEEADYYKAVCTKAIGHMENAKKRADNWIEQKKWKNLGKVKNDRQ